MKKYIQKNLPTAHDYKFHTKQISKIYHLFSNQNNILTLQMKYFIQIDKK